MLKKSKAWLELIRIGNVGTIRKDVDSFFKGNILSILEDQGFFVYLNESSRSLEEISEKYGWTDLQFLQELIDVLVDDNIVEYVDGLFKVENIPKYERKIPTVFTESVVDIWEIHAKFIIERLKGKFMDFTGGFNLFNWDDALTNRMYTTLRKAAFAYSGALKKGGKFLDVGCGNGYGTSSIWSYYYNEGKIGNGNSTEIIGIDVDDNLLEIAENEFPSMVKKHLDGNYNENIISKHTPVFKRGSVENIPFEDNTFDYVYASQVLHWADGKNALKEMLRVTKPGGIVFGTQNLFPDANRYNELHFKIVRGAGGFFSKEELYTWAKELGASKVSNATPITIYKLIK